MTTATAPAMSLKTFMTRFADQLNEKIEQVLPPIYKPSDSPDTFDSLIEPYSIQREIVKATKAGYDSGHKALFIVAEMGAGKSLMGTWTAHVTKAKRSLIVCPPHLVKQWKAEVLKAYPYKKVAMIPNYDMRKQGISDMLLLQAIAQDKTLDVVIISREAIKTDLPWKTVYMLKKRKQSEQRICPTCFQELDFDTILKIWKQRTTCSCGGALYTYHTNAHSVKPSLVRYITKKMKNYFDFVIIDEVHEMKAADTSQGAVLGKLAARYRTLCLTGTLMGGKASDIYHLLFRTNPASMKQHGLEHNSVNAFVERFGVMEKRYKQEEEDRARSIGRKKNTETVREQPGISPLVVGNFLIDRCAFLRLTDFAERLPVFMEHPIGCDMHPAITDGYEELMDYKKHLRAAAKPAKIVSSALQAMLRYADTHQEENICDEKYEDGELKLITLIQAPAVTIPLGETAKEQKLLEILLEAKREGRKALIFTTQTKMRNVQPRLQQLLDANRIKAEILYNTVSTNKRQEWIERKTPKVDALICHPRLVSTGMNLLEYPVIVFFDTGYSTYTLRQASRRSYRINQRRSQIDVYYLYTNETVQSDCLSLMATKNEVSLLVEGEISDSGLSALSVGGGNILSQLAKVVAGELKTENPLEVFSRLNKLNNKAKEEAERARPQTPKPLAVTATSKAVADFYIPPSFTGIPMQASLF